jgi:hypothetical protein
MTRRAEEIHATFEAARAPGGVPGEIASNAWFKLYLARLGDGPARR